MRGEPRRGDRAIVQSRRLASALDQGRSWTGAARSTGGASRSFSRTGQTIVTTKAFGTTQNNRRPTPSKGVLFIALSTYWQLMVFGTGDQTACRWAIINGHSPCEPMKWPEFAVNSVSINPYWRRMAQGSDYSKVSIVVVPQVSLWLRAAETITA